MLNEKKEWSAGSEGIWFQNLTGYFLSPVDPRLTVALVIFSSAMV